MRIIIRKAIVTFIGCIMVIMLIEVALHIAGLLHHSMSTCARPRATATDTRQVTIACLGDSYTHGMGAPRSESYPRQLERLLHEHVPDVDWQVLNLGEGFQNSTVLLRSLESRFANIRPDIVLLMTGGANQINFIGYDEFAGSRSWQRQAVAVFDSLRVFRFGRLLAGNFREKLAVRRPAGDTNGVMQADTHEMTAREFDSRAVEIHKIQMTAAGYVKYGDVAFARTTLRQGMEANPYDPELTITLAQLERMQGDAREAIRLLEASRMHNPENIRLQLELGVLYTEAGRTEEGLALLEEAGTLDPGQCLYEEISYIYEGMGKDEEAIAWLEKGITCQPHNGSLYAHLGNIYLKNRDPERTQYWYQRGIEAAPGFVNNYAGLYLAFNDNDRLCEWLAVHTGNSSVRSDYLRMCSMQSPHDALLPWIRSDLAAIISMCRTYGCPVIMQTYPSDRKPLYTVINEVVRDVAHEYNITLVDHGRYFDRLLDEDTFTAEQLFSPDFHCTVFGYGIVARNLLPVVIAVAEKNTNTGKTGQTV